MLILYMIINSATGGYALGAMSSSNGVFSNTMTWDSDVNTVDINVLWSKESFGVDGVKVTLQLMLTILVILLLHHLF